MSRVAFTTFQLKEAAYQWWQVYEVGIPAEETSLTWDRFSEFFLRVFVPQTLWDAWRTKFERLHQGTMSVSYAIQFCDLSRHAPALVAIVRERVCRFIEGLNQSIRYSMARELELDTPYQQVVEIAQRLEGMQGRDKDDREAKRSRGIGGFSGGHATASARHSRGYVSRPIHSALPSSSGAPVVSRFQASRFQLGPQTSQAMIDAPVAALPTQQARGRGRAGRVLLRG
nr:uncharacterized protein LOC117277711 [Nicotiana tomentosiformis]